MRFVIGGCGSGKTAYVTEKYGISDIPDADYDTVMTAAAVKNFHLFIKKIMTNGDDIVAVVDEMLSKNPDITVISTEIGYGVVPVDRSDREWRESVGRACCHIAERADSVVRIVCGIGNVIK